MAPVRDARINHSGRIHLRYSATGESIFLFSHLKKLNFQEDLEYDFFKQGERRPNNLENSDDRQILP